MIKWKFVTAIGSSARPGAPGVFRAIATAFDRVAARPYLILPALALDLFLWLGPRLNLAAIFSNLASSLTGMAVTTPEISQQVAMAKDMLTTFGAQFNLFSALSTFPIGVPSLMSATMPATSPLGAPLSIPLSDPTRILAIWLGLTIVGLGMASLYHAAIAGAASPSAAAGRWWGLWLRVLAMAVLAYLGILTFILVSLVMASLATLITPFLGTGVAFLGFTVLFWLTVYLIFTPHGLVRYRLGLVRAMRESVRIVRHDFFPTVALLGTLVILSWLTGLVWQLPPADSWFGALAILGHAFVSAMLLIASYVFYVGRREGLLIQDRQAALSDPAIQRRDERGAD